MWLHNISGLVRSELISITNIIDEGMRPTSSESFENGFMFLEDMRHFFESTAFPDVIQVDSDWPWFDVGLTLV